MNSGFRPALAANPVTTDNKRLLAPRRRHVNRRPSFERVRTAVAADNRVSIFVGLIVFVHIILSAISEVLHGWSMLQVWLGGGFVILWGTILIERVKLRRHR